jgi:hypothetical protein
MRIDSSGNVGIGTSGQVTRLAVAGSQVNFGINPYIALSSAVNTSTTYIQQQNQSTGTLTILTSGTGSNGNIAVQVGTGSTNALNVLSNGTTQFSTAISVGGATPTTSGAGITFPATQSASTDANTLDDYEEGTFTPVFLSGSGTLGAITYENRAGAYTKIGNVVYICVTFYTSAFAAGSGSGDLLISGLPFTGNATSASAGGLAMSDTRLFPTNNPTGLRVNGGTTRCTLYYRTTANGAINNLQVSDAGTGNPSNVVTFGGCYTV